MRMMGTPDRRQIDGVGGAHPLTSKVAVGRPRSRPDADVDYLFLQVFVDQPIVTDQQNCGNLLAGIGPFAVERGTRPSPTLKRRQHLGADLHGQHRQPGHRHVPARRRAARLRRRCRDRRRAGHSGSRSSSTSPASPAARAGRCCRPGNGVDMIDGVEVTLIDNGMPVVVMRGRRRSASTATSRRPSSRPTPSCAPDVESIRLKAGPMMNLGDVAGASVPKLTLVSPACRRRRHRHPHVHPPPLPRGDRRARCRVGRHRGAARRGRRRRRCCARAPTARGSSASTRPACSRPTIDATLRGDGALDGPPRRHHPHRPQADRRHRLPASTS